MQSQTKSQKPNERSDQTQSVALKGRKRNMIKSLHQILQITPIIWATLAFEIVATSVVYAILSTSGVAQDISFVASLCFAIVLILLSFLLLPHIFFGSREETLEGSPLRKTVNNKFFQKTRQETRTTLKEIES